MNNDIIAGNWKTLKADAHKYWGELTYNEIDQLEGTFENLIGLIQKKYGIAKDTAEEEINNFLEENLGIDSAKNSQNLYDKSLKKIKAKSSLAKDKAAFIIKKSPYKFLGASLAVGFIISQIIK